MSLELKKNNLYANASIIEFDNKEQVLLRDFYFTIDMFEEFDYHTVVEGDELSKIAYKYYINKVKDPSKYWGIIADVNNIINPLDISELVGVDIFIPSILEVKKLI